MIKSLLLAFCLLSGAARADLAFGPPAYSRVSVIRGSFTMPALNVSSQVALTVSASSYGTPYVIDAVYLDLSPLTLNATVGFRTKIDGSNYRQVGTDLSMLASAANKGVMLGQFLGLTSDSQVMLLSTGVGEPSQQVINYTVVIRY